MISHTTRDWLTKLQLIAAGCELTTVLISFVECIPDGVHLLQVRGSRRVLLARMSGSSSPVVEALADPRLTREGLRLAGCASAGDC